MPARLDARQLGVSDGSRTSNTGTVLSRSTISASLPSAMRRSPQRPWVP